MSERPNRFHLSMNVPMDMFEATVTFYATLFGGPPVKRKPGYAKFEPAEPYVNLAMNAVPNAPSQGELDHLGIQVFDDDTLGAARRRMVEAGLAVLDENEVECCFAAQNKFWVADPTGRRIEFFHVLRDVDADGRKRGKLSLASASSGACCAPGEDCG
jgi:catechol 2,3-dioxygenase-like lactoylglutathione lyase family enzyme